MDMFREPLPMFNINGHTHVRTYCGGLVTLAIVCVLFLYAVLKFQHLMSKHNPVVNTFVERDALDEDFVWTGTDNEDFMMAFTLTHFIEGEVKDDPKYVKWYAEYVEQASGNFTYSEVPVHRCTEEDMARFH